MANPELEQSIETPEIDMYGEFLNDLKQEDFTILPDEDIRERLAIMRDTQATDEERKNAHREIIHSSMMMIPFAIKKFAPSLIPPEEIIGEAFGVIEACVRNMDLDLISHHTEEPPKFSSYVFASLEKALKRPHTYEDPKDSFSLSDHVKDYASLARRAWEDFVQKNEREPSAGEWYQATLKMILTFTKSMKGITENSFRTAITHNIDRPYVRIGHLVHKGNIRLDTLEIAEGDIADTITDETGDIFEEVARRQLGELIQKALVKLSSRERKVISLKYGFVTGEQMTLKQIGHQMRLDRELVRIIEAHALRKLRNPRISRALRDFLD